MTPLSQSQLDKPPADNGPIPPLRDGDRLTRDEFERRYEAMPHLKKAELIEGVVHMPSPVRLRHHGNPHARLIGWLVHFEAATPGVLTGDNSTARLGLENEPQPDAFLLIEPSCGGQATISEDDYVENGPEFVGEVSASRANYDLTTKFNVYRRNRVREYVVWRVEDREIDWFVLRQGDYLRLAPDAAGVYRSEVFPGLWLDAAALVAGNLAAVLGVLQQGINTPEHAAFVARLSRAANP